MSLSNFARAAALVSTLLLLAVLPALSQAPAPASAPEAAPTVTTVNKNVQWIWTGYVQGRFTDSVVKTATGTGASDANFSLPRAYLYLDAVVNPKIDGIFNLSLAPCKPANYPYLLEGYAQYTFDAAKTCKVRLGESRIPYGYETPLSSAALITLERSQAQSSLLYTYYTFDRGLFGYFKKAMPAGYAITGFNLSAAVTNGTTCYPSTSSPLNLNAGTSTSYLPDPNGDKNVIARAGCSFTGGEIGASIYSGTSPLTNATMNRLGYDLKYANHGFTLLSEGIWGKDAYIHTSGLYATLAYQQAGAKGQPYIRLDTYKPDDSVNNNLYARATVGFNYFLTPLTRLTAEVQAIDNQAATNTVAMTDPAPIGHSGKIMLQYQISF